MLRFLIISFFSFWLAQIGISDLLAQERENIIDEVVEEKASARNINIGKGCDKGQYIKHVRQPVRAGKTAFKHLVATCGERAEFAMDKTQIGGIYWQGWSVYIPEKFSSIDSKPVIVGQWAAHPTKRNFRNYCSANGHYMSFGGTKVAKTQPGVLVFRLQHPSEQVDITCDTWELTHEKQMKGKWTDFVMHAKWTQHNSGFVVLWMKLGEEDYQKVVDYQGPTWWDDEEKGPYFKMGVYMGDPEWRGPESHTVYTDEYRLGNKEATFEDVKPGE